MNLSKLRYHEMSLYCTELVTTIRETNLMVKMKKISLILDALNILIYHFFVKI